jgi:hypothetical protein
MSLLLYKQETITPLDLATELKRVVPRLHSAVDNLPATKMEVPML